MKKILVLLSMAGVAQGSLLGWSEREEINSKKDNRLRTRNYERFNHTTELRKVCEVAPRGWISKYPVQTACDILHEQFNEIEKSVKNVIKDDAKETNLEYDQFVLEHKNLIKKEEVEHLTEIILNKKTKGKASSLTEIIINEQTKGDASWLISKYKDHFDTAVENRLRENHLRELSKKYSN